MARHDKMGGRIHVQRKTVFVLVVLVLPSLSCVVTAEENTVDWQDFLVVAESESAEDAINLTMGEMVFDNLGDFYFVGSVPQFDSFHGWNLSDRGGNTPFLSKFLRNNTHSWTVVPQMNNESVCAFTDLVIDDEFRLTIIGYYYGEVDFDNFRISSPLWEYNTFIAQADGNGTWLWAHSLDQQPVSAVGPQRARSIDIDGQGIPAISWWSLDENGNTSVNVARVNPDNGSVHTTITARASYPSHWHELHVIIDGIDRITITGSYNRTASFGEINLTTDSFVDAFVARVNGSGWEWASSTLGVPEKQTARIRGLTSDEEGRVFVTGTYRDEVWFDDIHLESEPFRKKQNIFVAALNSTGEWYWANTTGKNASKNDAGFSGGSIILIDDILYVVGKYKYNVSFDGIWLESLGYEDIFFTKFNTSGGVISANRLGGGGTDLAQSIHVDRYGSLFVTVTSYSAGDWFDSNNSNSTNISRSIILRFGQPDDDDDGVPNDWDQCSGTPHYVRADVEGCSYTQRDDDNDNITNGVDECPTDPLKAVTGTCGCNNPDTDSDNDGTLDCLDQCPFGEPNPNSTDQTGCPPIEPDVDDSLINDSNTSNNSEVIEENCIFFCGEGYDFPCLILMVLFVFASVLLYRKLVSDEEVDEFEKEEAYFGDAMGSETSSTSTQPLEEE